MTSLTMETDAVVLVDSESTEGFIMPLQIPFINPQFVSHCQWEELSLIWCQL